MNLEDDILIERFLRNELSDQEQTIFLNRLDNDSEFKECYLIEKQLFESFNEDSWSFVEDFNSDEIKEYETLYKSPEVNTIKKAIIEASKTKKGGNKNRIFVLISGLAATVALLFLVNVFSKKDVDIKQLYADNVHFESLPSFVTRSETDNYKLIDAEKLFKERRYEDALTIFSLELEEKNNSNIFIYKSLAEIELGKYKEAEATLNNLINSDLIDAEKGYWYKGLLFLAFNNKKEAKKIFNKIVNENLYKAKQAEEILEKL